MFGSTFVRAAICAGVLLATSAGGVAWAAFPISWSLSEFQPHIPHGGRVNTLAVNPTNDNELIASTESGGLFRTSDRGAHWSHIDAFKPVFAGAVVYMPGSPSIVIATARDLFASPNLGGIWRSTDGGVSWMQASEPPAPPGGRGRFAASEISIASDSRRIYVATSWGVAISDDKGVSWTLKNPFGGEAATSVAAQIGGRVVAGSPTFGISRSINHGGTWSAPSDAAGIITDMHAFGRSPFAADTFYAVNDMTALFVSEDSGATWRSIAAAPAGGGGCGGIAFIKAVNSSATPPDAPAGAGLRLYFGNRCGLYQQIPTQTAPGRYDYSASFIQAAVDHGDTRDLAFTNGVDADPIVLGDDGGIHKTFDRGFTWTFAGGGAGGFHALQITEVKGQWVDSSGQYVLYFGTQDNNLWASGDNGGSWPAAWGAEGFFLEMQKHVATPADARINFTACGPCKRFKSGSAFIGTSDWTNPTPTNVGDPTTVTSTFHVHAVPEEAGFAKGLAYTKNLGASWAQYATVPEDGRDIPKLTRRGLLGPDGRVRLAPVQYWAIRTGYDFSRNFEINTLVRVSKSFTGDTATASYPAMSGFGALGVTPTMFAWYQVFGVDPTDASRLIAPDVIGEKMMRSLDGGDTWTEIPGLTTLVTDGGRFNFRNGFFPFASAVSVFRGDPNMIGVGTHQNGLILSADRGATWFKVPNSERATFITWIEWKTATEAFVSTYGRGLWRLTGTIRAPWLDDVSVCVRLDCTIRYVDRGDPGPNLHGILVFDGRVLGQRIVKGRLAEVFVTPGSSIGFLGKEGAKPGFKITETVKRGLIDQRMNAAMTKGRLTPVGLVVNANDALVGFVGAKAILPISEVIAVTPPTGEKEPGSQRSPTAGKPYLTIFAKSGRGDAVEAGEPLVVRGRDFAPGGSLDVLIDEKPVGNASVAKSGAFEVKLTAPKQFGMHTLTVRDAASGKIIDGANFIVRHGDNAEEEERRNERHRERKPN